MRCPGWSPAAGAGTALHRLAALFAPFESLSHVLFWATARNELASVELPRLQLRFAPRAADEHGAPAGGAAWEKCGPAAAQPRAEERE